MYKKADSKWLKHIDFIILDVVCIVISFLFADFLRHGELSWHRVQSYGEFTYVLILIHFCVAFFTESYSGILRRGYLKEAIRVVKHNVIILCVALIYLFSIKGTQEMSRIVLVSFFMIDTIVMYFARTVEKRIYTVHKKYNKNKERLLLVVSSEVARDSIDKLSNGMNGNYEIIGVALTDCYDMESQEKDVDGIPVVATAKDVMEYARKNVINDVYIRVLGADSFFVEGLAYGFLDMGIRVHINIEPLTHSLPNAVFETINEAGVVTASINKITSFDVLIKRCMDICAGIVGCIVTGILFLFVAPAIKIADPSGPIFFVQERAGKNGKPFKFYKFRSMYADAEERKKELMEHNKMNGLMFKIDADPRIIGSGKDGTKKGLGHFLRATSIDEFPNFFSILKGDMSLVGTRPPTMDEYTKYEAHHKSRLAMKPGLTGLWQISGRSDMTDFEEIVKLDNEYIMNWSLSLDIKIVAKTFWVVIARKGSV